MPNWCDNVLRVRGETKVLVNFVNKHITKELIHLQNGKDFEETYFDLNTIIPEPTSPEGLDSVFIINDKSHVEKPEDKPWFNWYEWRLAFWGVKWNPSNCSCPNEKEIVDNEYDEIHIYFDTPWCPIKLSLFNKIRSLYPSLSFDYGYSEPGMCFCGYYDSNGERYEGENCSEELEELGLDWNFDIFENDELK